jgi:hypothetical protein
MTRFVRNPDGAVHSVPDDFVFPQVENGQSVPGWEDAGEADASPQLLGEPDPQVEQARLNLNAEAPVVEVSSSGEVGVPVDVPTPTEPEHAADAPAEVTE